MLRLACALLLWLGPTSWAVVVPAHGPAAAIAPGPSADTWRHVVAMGPWPPLRTPDASNRVSGQPLAIELGRRLFRDPRMSASGYIACVTCHQPDRAFTDRRARAHGVADLPRNTPALADLGGRRWYGWGGASDSLWMASIRPIVDPREIDGSPARVAQLFVREPELAACFRAVFGESPQARPDRTLVQVGKALAAFLETLVTGRTAFDAYRDAVLRGDLAAAMAYPEAARRGLALFVGRAGCVGCHAGPGFSDDDFHRVVVPGGARSGVPGTTDDDGRFGDAKRLEASRWNLLGPHNDAAAALGQATRRLRVGDALRHRFRTPGLRNVAHTAPYLHDGRADSLHDAVRHADSVGAVLGDGEVDDLVAFLVTLSDADGARRPWTADSTTRCP